MTQPELRASPEEITGEWLQEVLTCQDIETRIAGFRAQDVGTGQVGRCVRFELEFEAGARGNAPERVIGKFASQHPMSREAGVLSNCYEKEVGFYRDLASSARVRVPHCYFAAIDGGGPDHCLILEDMHPARQGDQLTGCSLPVAQACLRELAGLHASTWDRDELHMLPWLKVSDPDARIADGQARRRETTPGFIERFGADLDGDATRLIERHAQFLQAVQIRDLAPRAVVHGDFRLDNLLLDSDQNEPVVTVVDWQTLTISTPLQDVAYFLGASLTKSLRREHEQDLVREYAALLEELGIHGYAWDDLWQDYLRGSFAGISMAVVASMSVGQTPRGDEMFLAMARRHTRHALDLGADQLLR